MRVVDITGEEIGYWTVTGRGPNTKQGQAQWHVRCRCGNVGLVKSILLRRGISRSCGCLHSEELTARNTKHNHTREGWQSQTYMAWSSMVKRCTNPNTIGYANYGARGITVCERWLTFENFLADMGERPKGRRISVGRIDNDKGYEPGNCRWENDVQQARNRRNNRLLSLNGETHCVTEWAEKLGISANIIYLRLQYGWSDVAALTTPVRVRHRTKRQ